MKVIPALWIACLACIPSLGLCQEAVARLSHDPDLGAIHSSAIPRPAPAQKEEPDRELSETRVARSAAAALFVHSDLGRARRLATEALQHNYRDAEALFVRMEASAMQADQAAMLDSAVRLCQAAGGPLDDARVLLAAVRLRESAANTPEFRKQVPRITTLLANSDGNWIELQRALLAAAMDGVPGLDPAGISRAAGILTDWRVVVSDRSSSSGLLQSDIPDDGSIEQASYGSHKVESFQFSDGEVSMPDYFSRHGSFMAASSFASLTSETWKVQVETAGTLAVSVDGTVILRSSQMLRALDAPFSATFELAPGPHRVLVRFTGTGYPFRVTAAPVVPLRVSPFQAQVSAQEAAYLTAARAYVEGAAKIRKPAEGSPSRMTAPYYFLLAEAETRLESSGAVSDIRSAWQMVLAQAPDALAADGGLANLALKSGNFHQAEAFARRVLAQRPENSQMLDVMAALSATGFASEISDQEADQIWKRRLVANPSCKAWREAADFERERQHPDAVQLAQRRLEGCAPESLEYAHSLAEEGNHTAAAASLRALVDAVPLNRAARVMLVRELQLAGRDFDAQRAAAEWLQIAPNATLYRRLGSLDVGAVPPAAGSDEATPFWAPYQRAAKSFLVDEPMHPAGDGSALLLDDHVAIARQDGSVSLYIHTARRILSSEAVGRYAYLSLPTGAQVLQSRIFRRDGSAIEDGHAASSLPGLQPGDIIEQEYVVHYSGDGGIAEHSEVFQFVFGSFVAPIAHARFVVLTAGDQADRGVVIATGEAPAMTSRVDHGMLARVWQRDMPASGLADIASSMTGLAIVRVVEQEHGWSIPRNAERQRRIETIRPGPRLEES